MSANRYSRFFLRFLLATCACAFSAVFASTARSDILNRTTLTCSALIEQDVIDSSITVLCGIPPESVVEMIRAAVSGRAGDYDLLIANLERYIPENSTIQASSLASFFTILGDEAVPLNQLQDRLAEIAYLHLQLQNELRTLQVDDPEIENLIVVARSALAEAPPDHNSARRALTDARSLRKEKRKAAQALLDIQAREEAQIVFSQAILEESTLNFLAAGRYFEDAVELLLRVDAKTVWDGQYHAARNYSRHGEMHADVSSLEKAIELTDKLVADAASSAEKATVLKLRGKALSSMGIVAISPDFMMAAVEAERLALTIAEQQADQPAATSSRITIGAMLSDFGAVLLRRGDQDSAREAFLEAEEELKEAIAELDTFSAPSMLARAQGNLGSALWRNGDIDGSAAGLAMLENAAVAFDAALSVISKSETPFDWAIFNNSRGAVLFSLSQRNGDLNSLVASVEAYTGTLGIWTRNAAPRNWAMTNANLAIAHTDLYILTGEEQSFEKALGYITSARDYYRDTNQAESEAWVDEIEIWLLRHRAMRPGRPNLSNN